MVNSILVLQNSNRLIIELPKYKSSRYKPQEHLSCPSIHIQTDIPRYFWSERVTCIEHVTLSTF